MRKHILMSFLALFLLISTVSGQPYLNENNMWENNLTAVYYSSLALGDINNDHFLDLIIIGKSDNGISTKVYINNGSAFLENITWENNLTNVHYGSVAFGDIDNDGDLDLALSGCSSGGGYVNPCDDNKQETFIYINNGTAFLENLTWEQNLEKVWRSSIAFGDINNDGNLDLMLIGQTNIGRVSKIYLNNKTSFIENLSWQHNLTNVHSGSIAIIDMNNDNYLDLVLTGEDSNFQKITKTYISNGTSFIENLTWEQNLINADDSSVITGDIDNDGDLDLSIIGCCDLHRTYNNTITTFQEIQKEIADFVGLFSGSQAFGDYNNDGYLDIITTGRESYTALYTNLGNGSYTDYWNRPEQQLSSLEYSSLVFGDLDNDMDLDLILTGWGNPGDWYQRRIYINNISSANTLPYPPSTNFNSTFNFSTGKLILSWDNGSDAETPTLGLYYNLRVGTCSECNDIVSGVYGGSSNPTAGYFGNMMQRKRIVLNRPDLENKTIYWAVQTIDTGLARSAWSAEQVYEVRQSCTENWTYGAWSSCTNGQQTRIATDLNNCGTIVNRSVVAQSCSTGPSGPSGSSNTPTGPVKPSEEKPKMPENVTWYFETIRAEVDTGFIINNTELSVNQVWVKVKNEIREAAIYIKKLVSRPSFIPKEPEGNVYQYLNITYYNLNDSNIESGKIKFRVEKSWLDSNEINKSTVVLNRYKSSNWQEMKTMLISENLNDVEYQADTPGFSVFAISGRVLEENESICIPKETRCNANVLEECLANGTSWFAKEVCETSCENGKCGENSQEPFSYAWIILPIIVVVIAATGIYFMKTRKSGASAAPWSSFS